MDIEYSAGEYFIQPVFKQQRPPKGAVEKLGKKSEKDLLALSEKSKKEREDIEMKKDKMTKKKYWVT